MKKKKQPAARARKAVQPERRPRKSPSGHSNAHSPASGRASDRARVLAHVAASVPKPQPKPKSRVDYAGRATQAADLLAAAAAKAPRCEEGLGIAERLVGFLEDLFNGGGHADTLRQWRLTWARDIGVRIIKGARYDAEFAASYEASRQGCELLRNQRIKDIGFKFAVEGRPEVLFQGGKFCGIWPKFSEQLLLLQLKASDPAKYADRHELTGTHDAPFAGGVIVLPADIPAPREHPPTTTSE